MSVYITCPRCDCSSKDNGSRPSCWSYIVSDDNADGDPADGPRVFVCPCGEAIWVDGMGWYRRG